MTDTATPAGRASGTPRPTRSARPPPAEFQAGRQILAAAGLLAEPVRFAYYGLEEPPRTRCWRRRPGGRPSAGCGRSSST